MPELAWSPVFLPKLIANEGLLAASSETTVKASMGSLGEVKFKGPALVVPYPGSSAAARVVGLIISSVSVSCIVSQNLP